jgi:hypothetical protein
VVTTVLLIIGPDAESGETHLRLTNKGSTATTATATAVTASGTWGHVYDWTWRGATPTIGSPQAVVMSGTQVTIKSGSAIAPGATLDLAFDSDGNFGPFTVTCP